MTRKLTPWYPPEIKPVRKGVYQVDRGLARAVAYWNGEKFGFRVWRYSTTGSTVTLAYQCRFLQTTLPAATTWRGLVEKPK